MKACKCGHPPATHVGGAGLCTDSRCPCDAFVERSREISAEVLAVAQRIALEQRRDVLNAFQDYADRATSWQREAEKLLAQRDYAERRTNELEHRHSQLIEQMRAVLARFDQGAAG